MELITAVEGPDDDDPVDTLSPLPPFVITRRPVADDDEEDDDEDDDAVIRLFFVPNPKPFVLPAPLPLLGGD